MKGFFIIGVALVVIGLIFFSQDYFSFKYSAETTGTVVEIVSQQGSRGRGTVYAPIFSYSVDGQEYRKKYAVASNPPDFEVGDQTTIYYDKNNPAESELRQWVDIIPPFVIAGVGLILLSIGVIGVLIRLVQGRT